MNTRFLYLITGSSQSVSIYRWEIEAKISVSVSISRFLRLRPLLYPLHGEFFAKAFFWAHPAKSHPACTKQAFTSQTGFHFTLNKNVSTTTKKPAPPQPPSHPPLPQHPSPSPPLCHPRSRFLSLPLCGACPIVGYCGFLNKLLTQKKNGSSTFSSHARSVLTIVGWCTLHA